nr:Cutinase [Streptococcus thermophilus]
MSHFMLLHRRHVVALIVAFVTAVTATLVPVAPKQAEARQCPAVAVIAARGSGQPAVGRTSYGANPWTSNGWEGEHIRAFLQKSEQRYRATHGGRSMMSSVEVLGLGPDYYPAFMPEYNGPIPTVPQTLAQTLNLVGMWSLPAMQLSRMAARDFLGSVDTGRRGVIRQIDNYQRTTGCRPQYVFVGFSQGAMILQDAEKEVARRGQLAGAVYLGNPMTAPGDPATVGVPGGGAGGLIGWLPENSKTLAATPHRANYCLPLDGVCDASVKTARASEAAGGGNHGRYFIWPSRWDNIVSDRFGSWVDRVRYR